MAGTPIGLDFNAVIAIGTALDADLELLAETLPEFEALRLAGLSGEPLDAPEQEEPTD